MVFNLQTSLHDYKVGRFLLFQTVFFSMPIDLHSLTWRYLNENSVIFLAKTDPLYFDLGLFEKSWKYVFFWVYTSKTKRKKYISNFWGRSINLHTIYLFVCQCSWLFVSIAIQIRSHGFTYVTVLLRVKASPVCLFFICTHEKHKIVQKPHQQLTTATVLL